MLKTWVFLFVALFLFIAALVEQNAPEATIWLATIFIIASREDRK